MQITFPRELIDAIRTRNIVLFAGAGVSVSLGLPTWDKLITKMAVDLGYDPDTFRMMGDHLALAEYYTIKKNIGDLRSWMDVNWHGAGIKIERSYVHELIVKLNFPIIYTTNYDRWIERSFEHHGVPFHKITTVKDLAHIDTGYTQIVKFHGDFSSDDSMVLTEESFFERLSFESPLDIKLRSDILGKTVLFIGYSLRDINMRLLWYKLDKIWSDPKLRVVRPKSYIFLTRSNEVQQEVLRKRGIESIFGDQLAKSDALEAFLSQLYNAKQNPR